MKLLKWLLPVVLILLSSATSFSQININTNDSIAVIELRDNLGLSSVAGIASPNVSTWIPTYIDTIYDPTTVSYKVKSINFDGLVAAPATTTTILPDSIITDIQLNFLESLSLRNNGIDDMEGNLYVGLIPPSLTEINLNNNTIANTTDFFVFLLQGLTNLEVLNVKNSLLSNASPLTNYTIPNSAVLEHLDISDNDFTGTLDVTGLVTNRFPGLLFLYANDNDFSTLITPTTFSSTVILEKLSVNNNLLQDFKPFEDLLNNVTTLKWLYAHNALDTVSIQDSLEFSITTPLLNLKILDISYNLLRGVLPADMVERIPNIEVLYINNNQIRGNLPQPIGTIPAPINNSGYEGFDNLKELDISNNLLKGELRIDWLFGNQLFNYTSNSTMPIEAFYANGNKFNTVKPSLNHPLANTILNNSFGGRFDNLEQLEVGNNILGFSDLFKIKRIFNLKQISGVSFNHYIPQEGIDSTSFVYAPQKEIGIGGIRRRTPGSSILFTAGAGIIAQEQTQTNYITNQYTWERIDTANIVGGSTGNPVVQTLGLAAQQGGTINPNLTSNNIVGDPSFVFGVDTTAVNIHRLAILPLDSATHSNWLYRAQINNDSFPSLTLYSKPKKVEVGFCTDSSGANIFCQSIIVQFDPDSLAQFSTQQEQDSFRTALRESLGVELIEECLCGDIELWALSDTAKAMLESNGKGTKRAASAASGKPELLSADPNYPLLESSSSPNSNNANLPTGAGNSTASTLVAIIDSGVDYDYTLLTPYLSEGASTTTSCLPNATFGYNFVDDNNNATDDHGHGTSVAGIVAGISQQNILPDTGNLKTDIGILPLKYTDKNGAGSLFHAACALRYAADYERPTTTGGTAKVRVINTSWGYYGDPCIVLENVIEYAAEECDILIVASAGNDATQVHGSKERRHWPSNSIFDPTNSIVADNILSVAGVTPNGAVLNPNSNYSNIHIDLAAPWNDVTALAGSNNSFHTVGGTSFAAPQVTRAAALLFDKYPDATYFAVKHALMEGVDILPSADSAKLVSGGRINYAKADSILNIITNRATCTPNITVNVDKITELSHSIKIYPNPFSNNLTLEFDYELSTHPIELKLFNISGQEIHYQRLTTGTTNTNVTTENLTAGIYFMQVTINNKLYSQKIIKF